MRIIRYCPENDIELELLVKTMAGLEPVLKEELEQLGATDIQVLKRAVRCHGDMKLLYRANLELHTALRILVPISRFRAPHENSFYKQIKRIDWTKYLNVTDTIAVDAVSYSKHLNHTHYLALRTKDAIVDQFRKLTGDRPNVDVADPTLRIHVHISKDECTLALDSSGDSLHKRGYRLESLEAPINEVLAAGLIALSGWEYDCNFIDPMCGSGTFLVEAALWAYGIPPQLNRSSFGFFKWKDFDERLWHEVKRDATGRMRSFDHSILGYDKSFKAIKITQENIFTAHLEGKIEVERRKFQKLDKPGPRGMIIMNPPYDERLGEEDVGALYREIGDRLKNEFSGYTAWLISSNKEALKQVGLRPSRKITVFNGRLECKFQKFELYEGSKKSKNQLVE